MPMTGTTVTMIVTSAMKPQMMVVSMTTVMISMVSNQGKAKYIGCDYFATSLSVRA